MPLPTLSNGISENPLQTTTVEWMSGIPESPGPDIIEKLKGHSTPYIAGATITAFLIFLIYLCSIKITVHKSSSDRKRTLMMPSVSINRRLAYFGKKESVILPRFLRFFLKGG